MDDYLFRSVVNRVQFAAWRNTLDVTKWAWREVFEFFRRFDKPYFNISTTVDISKMLAALRRQPDVSVSRAYHYLARKASNEIEPFRYRLKRPQGEGKAYEYFRFKTNEISGAKAIASHSTLLAKLYGNI